jgi:hypothetical protein
VRSVKTRLEALKKENDSEELRVIGLSAVNIDCDLEKSVWHGTNILVILV